MREKNIELTSQTDLNIAGHTESVGDDEGDGKN